MPTAKKITPFGLIGSIMTLAAFVGMVFTVDARYITRAEAADKTADVLQQQQMDRVETDVALVDLEIKFQEDVLKTGEDHDKAEAAKRLEYLKQKKLILEKYQLDLQSK
jgi:hypothetical protein